MSGGGKTLEGHPDLTAMMDLTFNLMSFFVMLTTLARDDAARQVNLPAAVSAPLAQDERTPDSFSVNVAHLDPEAGAGKRPMLLVSGLKLDLTREESWKRFEQVIRADSEVAKQRLAEQKKDWKKGGLPTTVVLRVDKEVDFAVFRRVIDECRRQGYRRFQYKAAEGDAKRG